MPKRDPPIEEGNPAIDKDNSTEPSLKRFRMADSTQKRRAVSDLIWGASLSIRPDDEIKVIARALRRVFEDVYDDDEWKKVLNPKFNDQKFCEEAVKENKELQETLRKCLRSEPPDWQPLFDKPFFGLVSPSPTRRPPFIRNKSPHSNEQERAMESSWEQPYQGEATDCLWEHILDYFNPPNYVFYARYCAILQSSGTGKSRTVDELAKNHFVIPLNIRGQSSIGFPPADHCVLDYLMGAKTRNMAYQRSWDLLQAMFEHTITQLRAYDGKSSLAKQFRAKMTDGQTMGGHNKYREDFYNQVIDKARTLENGATNINASQYSTSNEGEPILLALTALTEFLAPHQVDSGKNQPLVIIAIDEAHTITQHQGNSKKKWSVFNELCDVLRYLVHAPLFTLFLSTTGKFWEPADTGPHAHDPSARVFERRLTAIPPYTDLGFDLLVERKIAADGSQDLKQLTEEKQMISLGRPLFISRYNHGSSHVQNSILQFACSTLLNVHDVPTKLSDDQRLACLAQRIPIEFYSTNHTSTEQEMRQVAGHMRLCLKLDAAFETTVTVSPSEPILSEAAYAVMVMEGTSFKAHKALKSIMESYAVSKGDRGEYVALLLLTLARDATVGPSNGYCRPMKNDRWFRLVPFLYGQLLRKQSSPSECVELSSINALEKLQLDFPNANLYFNHFVKVFERNAIDITSLLLLKGRGAAVLCADGQTGVDAINVFLYDGIQLSKDNAGLILYQIKNDPSYTNVPDEKIFHQTDPYKLFILESGDRAVPLIKVVFALAASTPSLHVERHAPNQDYNAVVYEIWCAGISPSIFAQVEEEDDTWYALLQASQTWKTVYTGSQRASDLRKAGNPGAARDPGHYKSWGER